jgi:hypothetical protein
MLTIVDTDGKQYQFDWDEPVHFRIQESLEADWCWYVRIAMHVDLSKILRGKAKLAPDYEKHPEHRVRVSQAFWCGWKEREHRLQLKEAARQRQEELNRQWAEQRARQEAARDEARLVQARTSAML